MNLRTFKVIIVLYVLVLFSFCILSSINFHTAYAIVRPNLSVEPFQLCIQRLIRIAQCPEINKIRKKGKMDLTAFYLLDKYKDPIYCGLINIQWLNQYKVYIVSLSILTIANIYTSWMHRHRTFIYNIQEAECYSIKCYNVLGLNSPFAENIKFTCKQCDLKFLVTTNCMQTQCTLHVHSVFCKRFGQNSFLK